MLNSDLFTDIKNAFLDWMDDGDNSGGNVGDTALSLLNRAQDNLERYDAWDLLVKDAKLTLGGSEGRTANFPSDFGEIIDVFLDTNSDGKPESRYTRNSTNIYRGYSVANSFSLATGHALVIQFFAAPQNTPVMRYKAKLVDFTGTGTEYSFFPFDLLLLEAQYIHIVESGLVGPEYSAIVTRRKEVLRDYRQEHQYKNNAQNCVQNDDSGLPITNVGYSMLGGMVGSKDGLPNDFDRR